MGSLCWRTPALGRSALITLHISASVRRSRRRLIAVLCGFLLLFLTGSGCSGIQSALDPAGREAERLATLFWWMAGAAAVIWAAVIGLALYALHNRVESGSERQAKLLIIGGGALVPTLLLAGILAYALWILPDFVAPAPEGSLRIEVVGERWWWRIRYPGPGGDPIELANEIRIPVGEPVEFLLSSSNVIHSFWIPSLSGKRDMIPGRLTRIAMHPFRTGIFRGACAEYCGASHAFMSFYVAVLEPAEFQQWLERQAQPATQPEAPLAAAGQAKFLANGCGACHTIRGTPADGVIGPDLTHVGSRISIGAGMMRNEPGAFARWISSTEHIKPDVQMPSFGMLPAEELEAIVAYLESLK